MMRSSALLPCLFAPLPCEPRSARQKRCWAIAARLLTPFLAMMTTLPPPPPSPPSGPPLGTYFSRRKLAQPLPPFPPCTSMVTRSTNIFFANTKRDVPARRKRPSYLLIEGSDRQGCPPFASWRQPEC